MAETEELEKVPTGIEGLDKILNGGIPMGNLVLLAGPPGTGKSTFGVQFLIEGAKNDEKGVYVSLGEKRDRIIRNLREFGWDIDEYIEDGTIEILCPELYQYEKLVRSVKDTAKQDGAERLVLDSITVLKSFFEDPLTIRKRIMAVKEVFDELGATSITMSESTHEERHTNIGVEEYVADGVIHLYYSRVDDHYERSMAVKKMRGTEHSMEVHSLKVGKGGIDIEV